MPPIWRAMRVPFCLCEWPLVANGGLGALRLWTENAVSRKPETGSIETGFDNGLRAAEVAARFSGCPDQPASLC
jgi:hypothetical protein